MPLQYPKLNGHYHSWASLEILVGTRLLYGGKSLDYGDSCEPGQVRGNARAQKIGRTQGDYEADGSLELFLPESEDFEIEVTRLGGIYTATFQINVSWANGVLTDTISDSLMGCRVKNMSLSGSQGNEATTKKYDLDVMYILHNGRPPLPATQMLR
jgi:hypothetical protein